MGTSTNLKVFKPFPETFDAERTRSGSRYRLACRHPVSTRIRKPAPAKRELPFQGIDVASLPERYAMKLTGTCLKPEIAHGAFVEFSKTETPQVGDYVILFKRAELLQPDEPQCYIKRLVMSIPDWVQFPWQDHPHSTAHPVVMFEQLNPPRTYTARCSVFTAIHKMVGVLTPEQVRWPWVPPVAMSRAPSRTTSQT